MFKTHNVDAPLVPILFCGGGLIILALGFIPPITIAHSLGNWIGGGWLLICGLIYLHTSLVGKPLIWQKVLQQTKINANGNYLDIGCGHGLVMFEVAKRLQMGQVIGIDIWNNSDQAHNSIQAVTEEIQKRGLNHQVSVQTADMWELPFADNTFDGITASFAIHNVKPASNRYQALAEMVRVLKPNGQLIIVDTEYKDTEFITALKQLGVTTVKKQKIGFNGWWGGPWMASFVIRAQK